MRVEEIKAAIERLPGPEFVEIRRWVAEIPKSAWMIFQRHQNIGSGGIRYGLAYFERERTGSPQHKSDISHVSDAPKSLSFPKDLLLLQTVGKESYLTPANYLISKAFWSDGRIVFLWSKTIVKLSGIITSLTQAAGRYYRV